MEVLEKEHKISVKSHSSTIEQNIADKLIAHFGKSGAKSKSASSSSSSTKKTSSSKSGSSKSSDGELKKPEMTPRIINVIKKAKPNPEEEAKKKAAEEAKKKAAEEEQAKQDQPRPRLGPIKYDKPAAQPPTAKEEETQKKPRLGPIKYDKPAAQPKAPPPSPLEKFAGKFGKPSTPPAAGKQTPPVIPPPSAFPPRPAAPKALRPSTPRKPRKTKRQIIAEKKEVVRQKEEQAQAELDATPKVVSLPGPLTVGELAPLLRLRETELIKHLFMKGKMVTVNQTLEVDFARAIAKEFEFTIQEEEDELEKATNPKEQYEGIPASEKKKLDSTQYKNLQTRPPVVSIMGHVDHGKTTLLDAFREARQNIVDTEAGGITQRIGAYTVKKDDRTIVFLDTPGHEAFTAMRMRGAQTTDIAILVVAADDGVMPQTIEAINHAKAAQIPIIIAVNKMDKAGADANKVLAQLMDHGLTAESLGGDTITVPVSALKQTGLEDVLDNIIVLSELLDLKADSTVPAEGVIVEAQLDKRMGPVASALVQNGTLRVGDSILMGAVGGRVRALIDEAGQRLTEAGPATPVKILGLNDVPNAGDEFHVILDDKTFKQKLGAEKLRKREQRLNAAQKNLAPGVTMSLEGFEGKTETHFNVIVKADTQGSLEAVVEVLNGLSTNEIKVNILHSATGDISEADVMLASAGSALIIGFNSWPDNNAQKLSEQQHVPVRPYDIIYRMAEDVEKMMVGKLSPEFEEIEAGQAEVRQIFSVGKNVIAGCYVTSGKMVRNAKANVLRNGEVIFTGKMDHLKRFKDDAKEVALGYECGISFDKFNDLQEGDIIAIFTMKELERTSL